MKRDALLSEQRLSCMLYADHVVCVIRLGEPIDEVLVHNVVVVDDANSFPGAVTPLSHRTALGSTEQRAWASRPT